MFSDKIKKRRKANLQPFINRIQSDRWEWER